MSLAVALTSTDIDGGDIRSEIWYLVNPSSGTQTITVTFTGTCDFSGASALSAFGVAQTQTLDSNASGSGKDADESDASVVITTARAGALIVDSVYHQTGSDLTVGSGQTIIAQLGVKAGGDRAVSSYEASTVAGNYTMNWDVSPRDKWVSVVASFAPDPFVPSVMLV